MTDKVQKIRKEVERLRKSYQIMYQELDCESPELMSVCAKRNLCQDILIFIDSLQEEPVSEELEEAIKQSFIYHENRGDDFRSDKQIETAYRYGFETGAKWLMTKAVETTFNVSLPSGLYDKLWIKGCKDGDKLLVIKKDEL